MERTTLCPVGSRKFKRRYNGSVEKKPQVLGEEEGKQFNSEEQDIKNDKFYLTPSAPMIPKRKDIKRAMRDKRNE